MSILTLTEHMIQNAYSIEKNLKNKHMIYFNTVKILHEVYHSIIQEL